MESVYIKLFVVVVIRTIVLKLTAQVITSLITKQGQYTINRTLLYTDCRCVDKFVSAHELVMNLVNSHRTIIFGM